MTVTIGGPQAVHQIRPGFLGLSLEFPTVEAYAGIDPAALNPVFLHLVRNISPGQQPSIRIGGDSTDWAWWPITSVHRPRGIRISLSPLWLQVTHALAADLNAKLILGINLEADNAKLAGAQARAFESGIGPSRVQALELGNEPELYHGYGWYKNAKGDEVPGRPANWSFDRYLADYAKIERSLPRVTLAGPSIGSAHWLAQLGSFAKAQRGKVRVVTVHRYGLVHCSTRSKAPSIADLLAPEASSGLAKTTVPLVATAHAHGDSIRVDEMNTVSCGGTPGVSNTFASALWTVDVLFAMARAGVDGVNLHTYSGATYELFTFKPFDGVWTASVKPAVLRDAAVRAGGAAAVATAAGPRRRRPGARMGHACARPPHAGRADQRRPAARSGADRAGARPAGHRVARATAGPAPRRDRRRDARRPELRRRHHHRTARRHAAGHDGQPRGGAYTVSLPAGSAALLTVR